MERIWERIIDWWNSMDKAYRGWLLALCIEIIIVWLWLYVEIYILSVS